MGALAHVRNGADDCPDSSVSPFQISGTAQTERVASVHQLVPLNERAFRHAAFEPLCRSHGALSAIARAWGVDKKVVTRVRDGLAPLTDDRIDALPKAIRARFDAALVGDLQLSLRF